LIFGFALLWISEAVSGKSKANDSEMVFKTGPSTTLLSPTEQLSLNLDIALVNERHAAQGATEEFGADNTKRRSQGTLHWPSQGQGFVADYRSASFFGNVGDDVDIIHHANFLVRVLRDNDGARKLTGGSGKVIEVNTPLLVKVYLLNAADGGCMLQQ